MLSIDRRLSVWAASPVMILLLAAGSFAAPSARASNWGALDADHRCTVNDTLSQCTANNGIHYVWIETYFADNLEVAIDRSLDEDYEPIPGIIAQRTTLSSGADVIAYDANFGVTEWWAYGTCLSSSDFGGSGISSWCRPQRVYFNNGYHISKYDNVDERATIACHELGHTLGLRHATSTNHPNPGSTCMRNAALYDPNLTGHDETHLEVEY